MKAVPPNVPYVCAEEFPNLLVVTILQPWRNLGWQQLSESDIQAIYYTCQNISASASVWLLGWGLLCSASPSLPFTITPCHSQDRPQHRATVGTQAASLGGSRWCFELDEQGSECMRLGVVLEGSLGTGDSGWAVESRASVPPTAEPVLPSAGGCCCIQISVCLLQCLGPDSAVTSPGSTSHPHGADQLPVPFLNTL